MNDRERQDWIMNDEALYLWWRASGLSMRSFLRCKRSLLDDYIRKQVGGRFIEGKGYQA